MQKTVVGLILVALCFAPVAQARGRRATFSSQGSFSRARQAGSGQRTYTGTRTGPAGQTATVERSDTMQRTGPNAWGRQSVQSTTGPNGQTRTRQSSGQGSVQATDTGRQRTYDGSVTNGRGQSTDVHRTTDITHNADGTVTRDTDATYTRENGQTSTVDRSSTTTHHADGSVSTEQTSTVVNGQGRTLGTVQSTTVGMPGQGWQTTGTFTGVNGATRTTTSNARFQYVDGKWVRVVEGESTPTAPGSP